MIIRTQSEHWSSLLSNEDHYDTVLVGSDKVQVQMHSYLLARCSQVMSDLLIEHRSNHNSLPVTIIVQDMEVDDIRHILQLLLTGEVHIEKERMEKFLENTKLFGLTNVCERGHFSNLGLIISDEFCQQIFNDVGFQKMGVKMTSLSRIKTNKK